MFFIADYVRICRIVTNQSALSGTILTMKTKHRSKPALVFLIFSIFAASPARSADALSDALQKGLIEEEANQNADAAIEAYKLVLQQFDEQRKIAATAAFRLGECYRKQGKTAEATAQFQRVAREFPDQTTVAQLSRKYLVETGTAAGVAL